MLGATPYPLKPGDRVICSETGDTGTVDRCSDIGLVIDWYPSTRTFYCWDDQELFSVHKCSQDSVKVAA